jgi:tRNA dimethylallyltransferase
MPSTFAGCWFLTGPTASGKTAVGIELAHRLGAEILSLDSMAVYRHMDIGTAKPTAEERAQIPHHLIDLVDPNQSFSIADYLDHARQAVAEIRGRGQQVLFVGGTPLYLKALLRGLFDGPPANWPLRQELLDIAQQQGSQVLHDRLALIDPTAAAKLHPRDTRRLIRALEVHASTGQPISQWQQQFDRVNEAHRGRVFLLDRAREDLHARINGRVEAMFDAGWIEEVRRVWHDFTPISQTAAQAVGYREIAAHLAGELSVTELVELVKTRTRQFAKRQLTWFRSLAECEPIPVAADQTSSEIEAAIAAYLPRG